MIQLTAKILHLNPKSGEMSVNGIGQGAPNTNHIFMTIWDGGGKRYVQLHRDRERL